MTSDCQVYFLVHGVRWDLPRLCESAPDKRILQLLMSQEKFPVTKERWLMMMIYLTNITRMGSRDFVVPS
jgi:hypothetical protein